MKIKFTSPLVLLVVDGKREFILTEDFRGEIADGDRVMPWKLSEGMITDLASVPHILEAFVANDDPIILKPGVLHDGLYQTNGGLANVSEKFTRAGCDGILREGMAACGSSWFKRWGVWAGVRAGGWKPWNAYLALSGTHKTMKVSHGDFRASLPRGKIITIP